MNGKGKVFLLKIEDFYIFQNGYIVMGRFVQGSGKFVIFYAEKVVGIEKECYNSY